jgi:nitrogen fixation NifU-like protein
MPDLSELYNELITDHGQKPRNHRVIEQPNRKLEGFNPLCGDQFTFYLTFDGDRVQDVAFQGKGCAISTASASMMTQLVKGKTINEVEKIIQRFHGLLTTGAKIDESEEIGKLTAFSGVPHFPVRVKCATLPWHTLKAMLHGEARPVSTE